MNDEREKPPECYNFSGIRDFLKPKKQHHHPNINLPNQPQDDDHNDDDDILKVTHPKNHTKGMKKVRQNVNNGAEKDENNNNNDNNNGQDGDKHKDYQLRKWLLKAIIAFVDLSKKKISCKASAASDPPAVATHIRPLRTRSLDPDFLSEGSGGSPSMKMSVSGELLIKEDDSCTMAPSMVRTSSKRIGGGLEERSNHGSLKKNKSIAMTKGKQVIMFSSSSGPLKPPTIEQKLDCTLEELCHGCVKNIKVNRDVFTCTGQRTKREEVVAVNIEPGWISGTKITFQGGTKEDLNAGEFPADIIFTISEKHHPMFRRVEDDLELEIEISLADALTGCPLTIPLLGEKIMSMEIDQVVYPGYEVTIVGQGMPNQKNPKERGDLKIKFLVNFPQKLTDEQREQVSTILSG